MIVSSRDAQIIRHISRFGMLTSRHINDLVFHDNTSSTPSNRVLARLTRDKYLARIERRSLGGTGGGSGTYVYQLASKGWVFMRKQTRYWPFRSINHHTLAIADAYVEVAKLERANRVEVIGLSTEPDCWVTIAGADLRPDMHLELSLPEKRMNVSLFVEADMGTERQKQLKEKLARYWHAYQHATEADMSVFPVILFLVPDDERLKELNWIINSGPDEAKALFRVQRQDSFPRLLLS
ncbi:replication-relaxation family protein [Pseudarthrobacter sp. H2]|uniref:replication-relaxation family protein n=1 Tax=Pseudarthrobacter sp. H2 TaxID=3418415 RepID=UPI003CF82E03